MIPPESLDSKQIATSDSVELGGRLFLLCSVDDEKGASDPQVPKMRGGGELCREMEMAVMRLRI